MPLNVGARLGPYEIQAAIGSGGMGDVYRARDTKLDRDVAVKVLPDLFAADPERIARFEREAKTLAALNHPNIAAIYGFEDATVTSARMATTPVRALVLELVEGPTLADRIAHGPLPLDEALPIAKQIAEALEAAHELGIIHRDLKPANVKVRDDGTVKVLDFGLAKLIESGGGQAGSPGAQVLTQTPTLTSPAAMTRIGVILGTAAYMSPEQAKGRQADRRSDIWAFGCVLYEMLTGRRAFEDDDVAVTLSKVLQLEPDFEALPAAVPARVRRAIELCLRKDPRQRAQAIGDVRLALEGAFETAASRATVPAALQPLPMWRRAMPLTAALLGGGLLASAVVRMLEPVPASPSEIRLEINAPPASDAVSFAISPDGQSIVFEATADGRSQLWVRQLSAVTARPLPGTDRPTRPFWSPDGRFVAFFADGALKRADIGEGVVQTLAAAGAGMGGAWASDGTILYAPNTAGTLFKTGDAAGEPTPATLLKPGQNTQRLPHFLPDGRHYVYYARGTPEATGVYLGQLESPETKRLFAADSAAVFASNHLLFVRKGTLFAQPFDAATLSLAGNPVPVVEGVVVSGGGHPAISASAAGTIVYRTGDAYRLRQLAWFDRSGRRVGDVGQPNDGMSPNLSPDGHQVALYRGDGGNNEVWLVDVSRGVPSRFTSSPGSDVFPVWSHDGRRIAFNSDRTGIPDLYEKPSGRPGDETPLLRTQEAKRALDFSADGRFLLFQSRGRGSAATQPHDLWALPLEGSGQPMRLTQTEFDERDARFSPDAKWIAYQSDESGRYEVYVRPFPGPGAPIPISTDGGAQVAWRPDGRELYFVAFDDSLMAVSIRPSAAGDALEIGAPERLFMTRIGGALQGVNSQQYMVSPDGRFLMNTVVEDSSPLTVILNWAPRP